MWVHIGKALEIHFMYLGSKEILCIFKIWLIISVLFYKSYHLFHTFIYFFSNNMFFINHVLNLNTHPSWLTLNFWNEEWNLGVDALYRQSLAVLFYFSDCKFNSWFQQSSFFEFLATNTDTDKESCWLLGRQLIFLLVCLRQICFLVNITVALVFLYPASSYTLLHSV
jgi:hypothetical protein